MQDDALPCPDFAARALAAIEERPDRIICFFVPGLSNITRMVNIQRKKGSRWLEFPLTSYVPLVATVFPVDIARRIVPFTDARRIGANRADDAAVATFCRAQRITACATVPSIVQHDDDTASVMGMRSGRGQPHRLAAWYDPGELATSAAVR